MTDLEKREKFIKASLRERYLLNEFLKQNQDFEILTITKSTGYEKYDAVICSGDTEYIVEIKCRAAEMNTNWGYMIEKDKYDYLIAAHKKNNLVPLYINFYPNGTQIWNLLDNKLEFNETLKPSNSVDYNANLVIKTSADLNSCNATGRWLNPMPFEKASEKAQIQYNKYFKPKTNGK